MSLAPVVSNWDSDSSSQNFMEFRVKQASIIHMVALVTSVWPIRDLLSP